MSVTRLLEKLRAALDATGIAYFVTGSFASSAHGVPRATNDIDIVIAPSPAQLEELLQLFPDSEFAKDRDDAFDALTRKSLFNVVDYATSWKIDFIVKHPDAFDASRFARRVVAEVAGVQMYTASAEDILLTKLWWAKLGESERQINDAAGIIRVQGAKLDTEYVERWAATLELETQLTAARAQAR